MRKTIRLAKCLKENTVFMDFELNNRKFYNEMKHAVDYSKILNNNTELGRNISIVLKKFKVTPNESFYNSVGFAIGKYLHEKKYQSQVPTAKNNLHLIKSSTQKLKTRINETGILATDMIGSDNLNDFLDQLNIFEGIILAQSDELEQLTKKRPCRPKNKAKHSLFISIADAFEKHLTHTPKKTMEGIFERTMLVILGYIQNNDVSNIHKTSMDSLNERDKKEHLWGTLIEIQNNQNLRAPFLISSFNIENKN